MTTPTDRATPGVATVARMTSYAPTDPDYLEPVRELARKLFGDDGLFTATVPKLKSVRTLEELEAELLADPESRHYRRDIEALRVFVDRLVTIRRSLGMTRRDLAKRMGVSRKVVRQLEGNYRDPRLSEVSEWTYALGLNFIPTAVQVEEELVPTAGD